jgi:hypothetical protein
LFYSLSLQINQSHAGYVFLERSGILQSLVDVMAQDNDSDIELILVKCAALKFFGKLSEIEVCPPIITV